MKRNIDLTLKRDFNKPNDLDNFFDRIRIRLLNDRGIPWRRPDMKRINSDEDLIRDSDLNYKEILITGDKEKRKTTRKQKWLQENRCDCCGKLLSKFPWEIKIYGLCKGCDSYYYTEKIIWRNRFQEERNEKRITWR